MVNPVKAELNPICHLLASLGAHHILHVSGVRVIYINRAISDSPFGDPFAVESWWFFHHCVSICPRDFFLKTFALSVIGSSRNGIDEYRLPSAQEPKGET